MQPKAKKSQFSGIYDDRLKLAIAAPPLGGKANKEVIRFLASYFGLKKKQVKIVQGERSRKKSCILEEIEEKKVLEKIAHLI